MIRIATVVLSLLTPPAFAGEPLKVAVFDFELIDSSLEGEMLGRNDAETRRLVLISDRLRAALADAPGYEIVDIGPVAEEAKARNLQNCGRCDAQMAREIGADTAITGTVQKVSNLILNINIYLRDAETGEPIRQMSADIRSNDDRSWTKGLDWLIENRLLAKAE